jgi:hypothetical protein
MIVVITQGLIKANPTIYAGVQFRSRLEARWAAMLDLCGWQWEYEPVDFRDWVPDFRMTFGCGHSECGGGHSFFVEVKPLEVHKEFELSGHPASKDDSSERYGLPILFLGLHPRSAHSEFCHGHGGGIYEGAGFFDYWTSWATIEAALDWNDMVDVSGTQPYGIVELLWRKAGSQVQWKGR